MENNQIATIIIGLSGLILGIRAELRNHRKHKNDEKGDSEELTAYYWMIFNDAFILSWAKSNSKNSVDDYDKQILEGIINVVERALPLAMRSDPTQLIDLNRVRDGARRILIYGSQNPIDTKQLYFGLAKFFAGVSSVYVASQSDETKSVKITSEGLVERSLYDNELEKRSEFFDKKYFELE